MKKYLFVLTIILPLGLLAQKNANIQVEAKPGISVFIDNVFQGKTSLDYGGLIIEDVLPGSRNIKLIKEGFNPQEEKISIKPGEVYTYKVRPFIPKIKISESGNTGQQEIELKVGSLKIQSLPISITIKIPTLGVNYIKQKDKWIAEEIPEGSFAATFIFKDKTINHTIEIKHNKKTHLMVNILKMEVESNIYNMGSNNASFTPTSSSYTSASTDINKQNNVTYPTNVYTTRGITIGHTTIDYARKLGFECNKDSDNCSYSVEAPGIVFYDNNCDGVIEKASVIVGLYNSIPFLWRKKMGFDRSLSYNEWMDLLEGLEYSINVRQKPHTVDYDGKRSLEARVDASKENFIINLNFSIGYTDGYKKDSKNTLFSISILAEPTDN